MAPGTLDTMTLSTIRAAAPADLLALVDLQNASSPDTPTTLELQQFRERNRRPDLAFGRLVAEQEGRLVGVGTFAQLEWSGEAGKLWVSVTVHPDWRRQGTGRALYDALLTEAQQHRPLKLVGMVREDRTDALHFASSRGYLEVAREQDVELEMSKLNTAQREPSFARAQAAGYTLMSFADDLNQTGPDLAWERYYALDCAASLDVPVAPGDSVELPPLARYRQSFEDSPTFDASLWFVAVRGDELAGLTQLSASPVLGRFDTGFTAVARGHRGHRLAWALKYTALEEAARRGAATVRTSNDATNMPMRNINAGLDFVAVPAYLTLSLTLPV